MSRHAARNLLRQAESVNPEELDKLIASNVRALRAKLRIRQDDLADDMGWTRAMIGFLESGRRRVTLADAVALCDALKVDLRQLLVGADTETLRKLGIDRRG